jgi:hypothetical protein
VARVNIGDIPTLPLRPALLSNISNLKVLVDGDFLGATVSFNVVALTNTASIILLRSFTNSILAAVQVDSVPLLVGAQSYDDRAAAIVGKQVWYWLQLTSSSGLVTAVGPVTVAVKAGSGAHAVNWVDASCDVGADDSVQVHVVCEVFPGADWSGGIAVFVQGYQGNPASVLIYQDTTEVLSFHLKMTEETVELMVAAVNAGGSLSALSAGSGLILNGVATNPARLTGLSALEGKGFTQVSFAAAPESDVILYRLYRGPYGGTFAQAAIVATLAPTNEPSYSIQDEVVNGGGTTYQWFVTAVNPVGESNPSDALYPAVPWA